MDGIEIDVMVRLNLAEVERVLAPDQIHALMNGIADIQRAVRYETRIVRLVGDAEADGRG